MRISDWSSDVCSSDLLTGSFAPGLYEDGNGKNLGHTVEFRSQVELGYQFENRSRLSLGFSHTSNGSLSSDNPGVEVLSLYYHLPFAWLFCNRPERSSLDRCSHCRRCNSLVCART